MAKGVKTGGRKAGTPNKATGEAKELARIHGPAAIRRAAEGAGLIVDPRTKKPVGMYESETAQMMALNTILDRAYGKATQPISGGDEAGAIIFGWLPSDG